MYEATLTPLIAVDGSNLALYDWLPAGVGRPRGVILLVHGLGEHMGRYGPLAQRLNQWGFVVRGYDQVGHGESHGPRGGLPSATRLIEDLGDVVDDTRNRYRLRDKPLPVILLGHSLGGLVAADFVLQQVRDVNALVLSSPAFDAGLDKFQQWLLRWLPRAAPNLRVGNGLKPVYLSHDPHVVTGYKNDPRVHDRISARLAKYIADAGPAVVASAPHWEVPTLLLYAGADKLVSPAGSRAFLAAAPRDVVQARCFERLFHEIFNERERDVVLDELQRWLAPRFPPL